jgi:hypothetical protein
MSNTAIHTIAAAASLILAACAPPSAIAARPPSVSTVKTPASAQQIAALNKVLEGALSGSYAEHLRYRAEVVDKLETLVQSGVLVPVDAGSSEPPEVREYTIAGGGRVFGIEIASFRPSGSMMNPGLTIHSQTPLDSVLAKLAGHVPALTRVKMSPGKEQAYSASSGIFPREGARAVGTVILMVYTFDAGASVRISSDVVLNESLQN